MKYSFDKKGFDTMVNDRITPFLKWPGGKRWISQQLVKVFPSIDIYIEPFLGSGAVFFELQPQKSIVSDINADLIEVYAVMKKNPEELGRRLQYHQLRHCKEYYYKIRDMNPRTEITRAARFLYLNRTCFNGMYRENKKGQFNVPMGTKNNCVYDVELFSDYSKLLQGAQLLSCDFEEVVNLAKKNDLIFADPPYAMINGKGFVKYNDKLFTWKDQERLRECLIEARSRGVNIVLTNAYCKEINDMYSKIGFYVYEEERICSIAGQSKSRNKIKELLITSYKI